MNAQHTQGRLHVGDGNNGRRIIYDQRGRAVADAKLFHARRQESEDIENARRLVACWNACEGMEDPEAEVAALRKDSDYLMASERLRAKAIEQRDELLTLLIRYRNETPLGHQPHMIAQDVDAYIAKVKGGAA